jgi:hypothetical protein
VKSINLNDISMNLPENQDQSSALPDLSGEVIDNKLAEVARKPPQIGYGINRGFLLSLSIA